MPATISKTCQQCAKPFAASAHEHRRGGAKFCTPSCYYTSRVGRPLSNETRTKIARLKTGSKVSEEVKARISKSLTGRDRGGYKRDCVTCSKPFRCNPSAQTVNCSRECSSKYFSQFSGPRSASWKGGLTPIHLAERRGVKYKEWRTHVFQRDDYTCQKCGQRGGQLQADHTLPFALYADLRFEILNGQTLCLPCHRVKTSADRAFIRSHETVCH